MNGASPHTEISRLANKVYLLIVFCVVSVYLAACGAQTAADAWDVYHAATGSTVNPHFPAYSFEHPSYWRVEESPNQLTFASESRLLERPPETLKNDQILVTLRIEAGTPLEEIVAAETSALEEKVRFEEAVAIRLNGRPAVYRQGIHTETGDEIYVIAVDMGGETRGLVHARMAEGKFEKWEDILFKLASSLQVEQ